MFETMELNSETFVGDCILCEKCGRVHFSTKNPDFWEPGELEELIECCKEHPEKFCREDNYDCIEAGFANGKQVVVGCPCCVQLEKKR